MIVVFTPDADSPRARKFGCVWPYIVSLKRLDAVVELMTQQLERDHGTAYEMPTYREDV